MKNKTLLFLKAVRAFFVVLLIAVAGLSQVKAQTFTVGDMNYSINEDGSTVTLIGHVEGLSGQIEIPESVELYGISYPVTVIGSDAFVDCGLTGSLVIPNSVKRIHWRAFAGNAIESITLGNSLNRLDYGVFEYCSNITEVTIPSSVNYLETRVFGGCTNLTTLNYNAEWVDGCVGGGWDNWLEGTSLTTVNFGDGVRRIPCDFLNNVGELPVQQIVLPESVTNIGGSAFNSFQGSINIPSNVASIEGYAFNSCSGLTGTLNLPEPLTFIGEHAFYNCTGLTGSLTIPNNVQTIEQYAFSACSGLSGTLTLGASMGYIAEWAFFGFMDNVTALNVMAMTPPTLESNVFVGSSATLPINVPCGTVEAYQNASGWNAFANIQAMDPCLWIVKASACSPVCGTISGAGTYEQGQTCTLTATCAEGWTFRCWKENGVEVSTDAEYSFIVEDNRTLVAYFNHPDFITFADPTVENICVGNWDTNHDGLLSYDEAAAVTNLGHAFEYQNGITSFNELQYFTGLTYFNSYEFYYCYNLASIILPESLTSIGYDAFYYCPSLSSLVIPENVTSIDGYAFAECYGLNALTMLAATPPVLSDDCPFCYVDMNNITVTVPCGAALAYQNTNVWNGFNHYNEPDDCVYETSLSDDFNDGVIDANLWATRGTDVYEADGWMKIEQNQDGNATYLMSVPLAVESGQIVIDRSFFLHCGNDEFYARTELRFNGDADSYIRVIYYNYEYDWIHGVYVQSRLNGVEYSYRLCNAVFDTWMTEKIVVDLTSGELIYFNDDNPIATVEIPQLAALQVKRYNVIFTPDGWWTGHQHYMDYINIESGRYVIAASANPTEGGTVSGVGAFDEGQTCTLTATPSDNYVFVNWTENGEVVSTDANYSFTVSGFRNLVANFMIPVYTITASANPTAGGTVAFDNGALMYFDFEDGTLQGWTTVDADGDGRNWQAYVSNSGIGPAHGGDYVAASWSWNNYTAYNPDNYLISPELINVAGIKYYLSTNTGYPDHYGLYASTTGNDIGDFSLVFEETIPVSKGSTAGTKMSSKGDGLRGGMSPWTERTIELPEGTKYVAFRHFNSYDMNYIFIDDITFIVPSLATTYQQGTTCTVTAAPNYGYAFVNWEENGEEFSTEAEISFTVTGDRDLVANFEKVPFAINVTANYDDRGSVTGAGEYVIDVSCTVTATPNAGHNFVRWMENGQEVSTEASYTFTVDGPRDLVAVFTAHVDDIIVFADPNVKAICVDRWDQDFDNELTYAEAAAVTNLNYAFQDNYSIYSFNELQYFTSLSYLNDWEFESCYFLNTITFPDGLTYIGTGAFYNTGLYSIVIPEGITSLEEDVFAFCYNLASVTFPNSLEQIRGEAFVGCSSLTSLDFPSSLNTIEYHAFLDCTGLTGTLEIPDAVSTIGESVFSNCTGLTGVVLPANIQYIGYGAFYNCSGLRGEITLGQSLQSVGGYAFRGCDGLSTVNYNASWCYQMGSSDEPVFYDCAFTRLNIGANVQNIPNFAFKRCFSITEMNVAAVLPPTIYSSTFGMVPRSIPVLVPSGSGDVYRNAQYWEEFFNILEDGDQYSFYWDVDAHQYAHNLSVIGVIQINGVEQTSPALEIGAFCGDECRGRQLLTVYPELNRSLVFLTVYGEEGDLITFRLYDHAAEEESTLACATVVTFEADAIVGSYAEPEVLNFVEMQTTALEAGWTWFSTYVAGDGAEMLQMMEESLGESGVIIKSHTDGFVSYDEFGWDGTLESVAPESMYMVNTSAPAVVSITGAFANTAEHPITLSPEWNWIGFPSVKASSVNNALSGFTAQDGDVIKTQEGFSQYIEGTGWTGALRTLVPSVGMMYHSLNGSETTLTYTVNAKESEVEKNVTSEGNHWVPDMKAYPYNMNVVAVVELDGMELGEGRYELAAFCGGECRGSVRLMEVSSLNRWMAFLTVSGSGTTEMEFALYDTETGMEYRGGDLFRFEQNAIMGSAKEPVTVRFAGLTGTAENLNKVTCYPNPVGRSQYVRVNLPAAGTEARVEVVNALGAVVSMERATGMTAEVKAPATAGVYVVRVVIDGKAASYAKLVVE